MTQEFISAHCIDCNYCIYSDGMPWGCGIIDEYGCCSTDLHHLQHCRFNYKPIPHTPRFKAGDRLEASPSPIRILKVITGVNGYYITQKEGNPNNIQQIDLEEIDYNFELVTEEEEEQNPCTQCPFNNSDCVYCKTCQYDAG